MAHRKTSTGIILGLAIVAGTVSGAAAGPPSLAANFPVEKLKAILLAPAAWGPFPRPADAAAWVALPAAVRDAHIKKGEGHLGKDWPLPKASAFLDFVRDGNRSRYESVSFGRRVRLGELVIAECFENKGRFLDEILNGVWTISEETFWGVPAHVSAQKRGAGLPDVGEPIVDLFAAETGMLLAWTDFLVGDSLDRISPLVRERIRFEVERRIIGPCLSRDDFWWMGFGGRKVNNWNPWICSNWLTAVLLVEPDPDRRARSVHKILRCLDNFLTSYPADGGCDEGPGYWDRAGGSLFDCLELLREASGGAIDMFADPLIKDIGRYIARAHIAGPYYLNFADAAAKLGASASLIHRYGRSIADPDLQSFGAWLAREQKLGQGAVGGSFGYLGRVLPALFDLEATAKTPLAEPLVRDVWLPELQVMSARPAAGSAEGLYLAAKGGHNDESHNHNDVGSFVVYAGGLPALIDVGVETYTAKTFSGRRYEIWTMQSAFHNLPTINGVMQKNGREFEAKDVRYESTPERARFRLDIAKAYPSEAGVTSWVRTLTLERGKRIAIEESFELAEAREPVRLTLMSARRPVPDGDGRIRLEPPAEKPDAAPLAILYPAGLLMAAVEPIPLEDERLRSSWGEKVYRILLTGKRALPKARIELRIEEEKKKYPGSPRFFSGDCLN